MIPEPTDNNFNFTFECGIGGQLKISGKNSLRSSVEYTHFSNGRHGFDAKNPTWDGIAINFGWVYAIDQLMAEESEVQQ